MNILSINEFIDLVNSTPIKITLTVILICLLITSVLFIKNYIEDRKSNKNNIANKFKETPALITMSLDDLVSYFKLHYNFEISEDSYKIVEKAKSLVDKVERLQLNLNDDLVSAQSGVLNDKELVASKINEIGGLIEVVDSELELMTKLFTHLKEHDESYEEELMEINYQKQRYTTIEKRILSVCIGLICEFPNS